MNYHNSSPSRDAELRSRGTWLRAELFKLAIALKTEGKHALTTWVDCMQIDVELAEIKEPRSIQGKEVDWQGD